MCIIAAKPAGVAMPSRDTIRTMWDSNRDGAGIMYVEGHKVHIEKGFMKYKAFAKKLDELERRLDLTKTPVVMHFRITTHGGTKPENCHPFPVTDSIGALKKTQSHTDLGVAHNGIIHIIPRSGISDTMEYIASQLAPLKRALPRFYENKNAMLLVKNAIDSKMAFLTKEGKIYTIGYFIEDEGVLYSNDSYQKASLRYRNLGYYGCYGGWDSLDSWDSWDRWEQPVVISNKESRPASTPAPFDTCEGKDTCNVQHYDECKVLTWLDDSDFIRLENGELMEGTDFLVDEEGHVWEYDYAKGAAVQIGGATAHTASGAPKRFDYDGDTTEMLPVVTGTVIKL